MSHTSDFMQIAIDEARQGIHKGHGGPFGAVIVKDGKVVGKGHNMVIRNNNPTCHGEVMAIGDACQHLGTYDLSGCTIYTTGEPCPMCLSAILWANIDKVYYGCDVQDTQVIGFRDLAFYNFQNDADAKARFLQQVEHDACLALYHEYASIDDKIGY